MSQLKVFLTSRNVRNVSSKFIVSQCVLRPCIQQLAFSDDGKYKTETPPIYSVTSTSDDYNSRKVQFSSSRSRDLMGQAIDIQNETEAAAHCNNEDIKAVDAINETADCHIDSYDSRGNISLHSAMQTMVPEPYSNEGKGSPSHLNMPGGHVLQGQKYLSDDLHNTHYQHTTTKKFSTLTIPSIFGQGMLQTCSDSRLNNQVAQVANMHVMNTSFLNVNDSSVVPNVLTSWLSHRLTYTQTRSNSNTNESQLSQRAKMKRAVKEYGATVVVFHVSISLVSLGGFYIAVSSGVDVGSILEKLPIDEALLQSKLATGVSTFALAYAVHKVFAPVRMAITLASTPFIVRYLRKVGFLKPPTIP